MLLGEMQSCTTAMAMVEKDKNCPRCSLVQQRLRETESAVERRKGRERGETERDDRMERVLIRYTVCEVPL